MVVALNADWITDEQALALNLVNPKTYRAAKLSLQHQKWEVAMEKKFKACGKMNTWTVVPCSSVPHYIPII